MVLWYFFSTSIGYYVLVVTEARYPLGLDPWWEGDLLLQYFSVVGRGARKSETAVIRYCGNADSFELAYKTVSLGELR